MTIRPITEGERDERQVMPNHSDLWDAYVAGALDGQGHPQATLQQLNRAADGWVKLFVERLQHRADSIPAKPSRT